MQKQRPSIALAMIVKNEAHNLGPLLQSVRGCFDEIHITDTGSTDSTLEFIEKINTKIANMEDGWVGFPIIKVHHFEWVNDFAAARNYSFGAVKSDYVMWMDGDDALSDREAFIKFRDNVLHTAHCWLATYNYEFSPSGVPICSFLRERIVKNNFGWRWKFFVHEGLIRDDDSRPCHTNCVNTWTIDHKRTDLDRKQDLSRNINLYENKKIEELEPRMVYYWGKELMDNGEYLAASAKLMDSLKLNLDLHDRIMALQCASQCAIECKAYMQGFQLAMQGIQLRPTRGEFWVLAGDAKLRLEEFPEAMAFYKGARQLSQPDNVGGLTYASQDAYFRYPTMQISQIYAHAQQFENADAELDELLKRYPDDKDAIKLKETIKGQMAIGEVKRNLPKKKDIIITCSANAVTSNWDENVLEREGLGGSETAAIEVAKYLHKYTGHPVKIFHARDQAEVMPSGVEYYPTMQLQKYLHDREPSCHIAWRHSARLTWAPSYIWSHDLITPGGERTENYDKYMVLSGFHQEYVKAMQRVPDDKFIQIRNGIDPRLWEPFKKTPNEFSPMGYEKDENKIIFSSSPDRGLDRSIHIVKKAREMSGKDLKLHLFYGYDNMRKHGGAMAEMADQMERLVKENSDFVVYHGNVDKKTLIKHFCESVIWLYPANFIETFCITAIEAICSGVYPLVRNMGALPYTLQHEVENGMATILNDDAETAQEHELWADKLINHIDEKVWTRVNVEIDNYSWENVARDFIRKLRL